MNSSILVKIKIVINDQDSSSSGATPESEMNEIYQLSFSTLRPFCINMFDSSTKQVDHEWCRISTHWTSEFMLKCTVLNK